MPSLFRTLLLAVASIGITQTRHVNATELVKPRVTSLMSTGVARNESIYNYNNSTSLAEEGANAVSSQQQAALAVTRQEYLSLEDHGNDETSTVYINSPTSVVQDWSLVCQQLCGAGLGGAPCASYCHSSETPSLLPAFDASKEEICEDLCRLQLGDVSCSCSADGASQTASENNWGDDVCSSFCDHSAATLDGCSPCMDDKEVTFQKAVVVTTTPDWTKLCAALCKTGDGGSLCNCDLVPFLYRI
ncbi:uncharacterized protein LOC128862581 [Anastrepha ludens]|uniref:uncharacterized protein LOC128862581 n=1 Tax=Anastrepha ludens TaxID=28586 RepID=UPI0023B13137|nr:uncharacterized protein LOC128862581 [Anastrepha ludens]